MAAGSTTLKNVQYPWAVKKHLTALAGTSFEKCAGCPGTVGRLENGKMRCSRAGATPVLITEAQAQRCDGSKPTIEAEHVSIIPAARAALASAK
jgi:hypothetical protein